jgi:hypothetical protein
MDNIRLSLDILFRKVNPEDIIKSCFEAENKNSYGFNNINKNSFINLGINDARYYSNDEMNNIYYLLQNWMKDKRHLNNSISDSKSIFNLFISFGEDVLIDNNGVPECKYEQMMRWRMIFHKLGQDLFTTAYFAYKDVVSSYNRNFFAWNPFINSNNVRLHNILKEGLAENHFHLKGSAPVFSLTWTSLMNRITNRENEFYKSGMMNSRLEPDIEYSDKTEKNNFPALCKKAAIIRAFLFCKLNNMTFFDVKEDEDQNIAKRRDKEELKKVLKNSDSLMSAIDAYTIQGIIDSLKYDFGKRFEDVSSGKRGSIDYSIPKNVILRGKDYNQYYVGERIFLYSMFKKIYKNDPEFIEYQNLFYAYIVIKSKLRGELIQINDRVGFDNFSEYQDRKSKFLDKDPLLKKAVYYTAIRTTMENQNIVSLEARITPENSADELSKEIYKMDKIINYNKEQQKKYFYVVHFIKEKDKDVALEKSLFMSPRHNKKRLEIKKQALAILKLRNSLKASAGRILGIDGCSNEIGCRPEVFAQVFRYLRTNNFHTENERLFEINYSMQLRDNYDSVEETLDRGNCSPMGKEHLSNNHYPKQLRATYHVGEDFLDIIDGLRAIDETVYFLNFSHGDRLGHALALGVDVDQWYNNKNKRLIMPKQDFLDNIVWMLIKIKEFNLLDMKNLIYDLEERYHYLFNDIYTRSFSGEQKLKSFSSRQYYDAWKLRGDDPEKYIDCKYTKKYEIHYWDRCAINYYDNEKGNRKDKDIREDKDIQFLYNSYHYNYRVRKKGAEQYEFEVPSNYIVAVKEIQHSMKYFILDKGIGIETNPSSNYLIGNFKRYDKHPIVDFYNLGLTADPDKINRCPQLFVSINTDDQGIFDTYIENEYALMALALEKAVDENGKKIYNQSMIYDWLNRIRHMGIEQSFNYNL